jgi:hypothetical protein
MSVSLENVWTGVPSELQPLLRNAVKALGWDDIEYPQPPARYVFLALYPEEAIWVTVTEGTAFRLWRDGVSPESLAAEVQATGATRPTEEGGWIWYPPHMITSIIWPAPLPVSID